MDFLLSLAIDPLTHEEEIELFDRWRSRGDKSALDRITRSQLKLVGMFVQRYMRRYDGDEGDIMSAGVEGLFRAIEKFDTGRDLRLTTYASVWIKQGIQRFVMTNSTLSGSGPKRYQLLRKTLEAAKRVDASYDRAEELKRCAAEIGIMPETLGAYIDVSTVRVVSMSTPLYEDEEETLEARVSSHAETPEQQVQASQDSDENRDRLVEMMKSLNPKEVFVMRRRHLCEDTPSLQTDRQRVGPHPGARPADRGERDAEAQAGCGALTRG